jgi:HlyD family secretion protein
MDETDIELRSEDFQEVLGKTPPWILRWGITVLSAIVVLLITGSALFHYPDMITAQVTLTGSTPPVALAARASGKLKELFVSDNEMVKAEDYLAVIDNPASTSDVLKLKSFLANIDIESDTIITLPERNLAMGTVQSSFSTFYLALFDLINFNNTEYYSKKIEAIRDRIAQYGQQYQILLRQQEIGKEQFALARKTFERDSLMHDKGGVSGKELDASRSQFLQSFMTQETMESQIKNMKIQISQLRESLMDTEFQYREKRNALKSQLRSSFTQIKSELHAWELNYTIVSPINGNVTFTHYWKENQNVTAGEEVFTVVPTEKYEIIGKALLPIARSGKVKAGQKVNIRLDNFPDTEYGILRGTVKNISLVPSRNGEAVYYTLEIALSDGLRTSYHKYLPVLPDMQGRADIITDDISLLERFFLPVRKIFTDNY